MGNRQCQHHVCAWELVCPLTDEKGHLQNSLGQRQTARTLGSQQDDSTSTPKMVVAQSRFASFSTQNPLSIYLNKQSTGVCTYARPAV